MVVLLSFYIYAEVSWEGFLKRSDVLYKVKTPTSLDHANKTEMVCGIEPGSAFTLQTSKREGRRITIRNTSCQYMGK